MQEHQREWTPSENLVKLLLSLENSRAKKAYVEGLIQTSKPICIDPGFNICPEWPARDPPSPGSGRKARRRVRKKKALPRKKKKRTKMQNAVSKIKRVPQDMVTTEWRPDTWNRSTRWAYQRYLDIAEQLLHGKYVGSVRRSIKNRRPWMTDADVNHVLSYWTPEDLAQEAYLTSMYTRRVLRSTRSILRRMIDSIRSSSHESVIRRWDVTQEKEQEFSIQVFLFMDGLDDVVAPFIRQAIYRRYTEGRCSAMIGAPELVAEGISQLSRYAL